MARSAIASLTIILVDTIEVLNQCLLDLTGITTSADDIPPCIAVDIEGVKLSRSGSISVVQMKRRSSHVVWLLDVTVLGRVAFDHADSQGRSIRTILENPTIKKLLYDVRNDADALFNLYGVDMQNVYDLQLLELAVRHSNKKNNVRVLNGLAKCIRDYVEPSSEWKIIKDVGISLFSPEKGGSFAVFEKRPLDPRLVAYCAQDVALLFRLEENLERRIGSWGTDWKGRVVSASVSRVAEARSRAPPMQGKTRAFAPVI